MISIIKSKVGVLKKEALIVSLFLAIFLISIYTPFYKTNIDDFNRLIGQATAANYSVDKLINHFMGWYIIVAPMVFLFIFYIVSKVFRLAIQKDEKAFEIIKQLNLFTVVAFFSLLIGVINRFVDEKYILSVTIMFSVSIIVITLFYLYKIDKISFGGNDLKWIYIISLSLYFPTAIILNALNLRIPSIAIYIVLIGIWSLIFQVLCTKNRTNDRVENIKKSCRPMAFSLLIVSLGLEAINILNQYEVFITNKNMFVIGIYIVIGIICSLSFKFISKRKSNKEYYWEDSYYLGIVASFAILIVQPNLQTIVSTDFFEQANGAVSISQLFLFGKIPFVETHGAHLFSDYIWGIIYGVLNRDTFGALFNPYGEYQLALAIIIMYFILKQCFDRKFAFVFTILYPLLGMNILYSHICMISILALIYVLKNPTTKAYYIFWITLAISVLYQGDIGLAYGIGSIIAYIIINIINKNICEMKKCSIAFSIVTSILVVSYTIICKIRGINIINRIKEFLDIMKNSNQNWAYSSLGDTTWSAFSYVYFFVPLIVIGLITYLLYYIYQHREKESMLVVSIALALGISYVVNIPRLLVRHSLLENNVGGKLFSAVLFIALVGVILVQKRKKLMFCSIFFGMTLFSIVIENNRNFISRSMLEDAISVFEEGKLINRDLATEKVKRVDTSEEMKKQYLPIKDELNRLLRPDETYIDFTNQSLLYSLTERNNPVFVNQSPGLLSGEFTQEQFIKQIEKINDRIPLAILPTNSRMNLSTTLDGIANSLRYYKVAEYIYNNYEPLEIVGDFAIWCKKELKEEFKEKLETNRYDLLKEQYLKLVFMDAVAKYENGVIQVETGASDPIIDGVQYLLGEQEINKDTLLLSIKYSTSTPGEIQLFYGQGVEEYTEENSIKQYVDGSGWVRFEVPYTEEIRLRLDPPSHSIFTIEGISTENGILCDYNYGDSQQLHKYNLGDIPYLWGTYDEQEAYNNKIIVDYNLQESIFGLNLMEIDKSKGNYLLVTINSNEDTFARVVLGRKSEEDIENLTEFSFNVKQGTNTYLIRCSSDFYWYAPNVIDAFKISTDTNAVLEKVQVLQGD